MEHMVHANGAMDAMHFIVGFLAGAVAAFIIERLIGHRKQAKALLELLFGDEPNAPQPPRGRPPVIISDDVSQG